MKLLAFIVVFGALISEQLVSAKNYNYDNTTLPKPHMIIVGPTGAGKSSLANALVGEDPTCEDCLFPVCHDMNSCTKNTNYCFNHTWLGDDQYDNFTIVDTPGFGDSDDEMEDLVEEMINTLSEDIKTADVIILTFPADTARFSESLTSMLKQLEMLFGKKMWNSTIIEISKFSYSQSMIDYREMQCQMVPADCRNEQYFDEQINSQLKEKFHLEFKLPIVFIDSFSQLPPNNTADDVQQAHWKNETAKLWDFAITSPEFVFKTVDEVLEENYKMKEEIEWLNEVITKNISELHDMLAQETLERKMNDDNLHDDLKTLQSELHDDFNTLQSELHDDYDSMQDQLGEEIKSRTLADAHIQQDINDINLMPIGSIIAWIPKPSKESENITYLPEGWVRCDGTTTIKPPSIWAGSIPPNLNGNKHFLRGGSDSEYLDIEEDQIQDLKLSITDPGHDHTAGKHSHDDIDDKYVSMDHWCSKYYAMDDPESGGGDRYYWQCKNTHGDWWATASRSTSDEQITIETSFSSISLQQADHRAGEETRPVNTKVIWIMRVW